VHESFVKPKLKTAVLVHGVGSSPAWWNPLLPVLKRAGLKPLPLRLPPLINGDPTLWRDEVVTHIKNKSVVLIGHSLGAAVCIEAALAVPVGDLVLLACPPFLADFTPPPPPEAALPAVARKNAAQFLRAACEHSARLTCPAIHFVGARDRWAPVAEARRLPVSLVEIPETGHSLNRSTRLADELFQRLRLWQNGPRK
jgi:pimeloyl-ACP methyl ester carboxylesterase